MKSPVRTVIPLPRKVLGWQYITADQSAYPSRPLAGTLDPSQAIAFIGERPGVSTYEVASRLGWSAKEAFDLLNQMARDELLSYAMASCVRDGLVSITYTWDLSNWARQEFNRIARDREEGSAP